MIKTIPRKWLRLTIEADMDQEHVFSGMIKDDGILCCLADLIRFFCPSKTSKTKCLFKKKIQPCAESKPPIIIWNFDAGHVVSGNVSTETYASLLVIVMIVRQAGTYLWTNVRPWRSDPHLMQLQLRYDFPMNIPEISDIYPKDRKP